MENPISRFPGAFPDPPPRKFSAFEWTRPLTKLKSNGESALIFQENPGWFRTHDLSIIRPSNVFNLKTGRRTRADLGIYGHKKLRKLALSMQSSDRFGIGKTHVGSSHFASKTQKSSVQKRRMAFFGLYETKTREKLNREKLSSVFLVISRWAECC